MKRFEVCGRSIFLLAALFCSFSCSRPEGRPVIGYVQITEDPVLNAAKAQLFKALADSGFKDGKTLTIREKNAQGDLAMIPMILQSFISEGVDVIVTNSTPCMVSAAQLVKDIPVVFTVAFGPEQVGLKKIPVNLYGVYDPLRSGEFADVVQKCLPGLKKIGLPYNTSEPNAVYSAKIFSGEFSRRGIEVVTAAVTSSNDILNVGQYLAQKDIGAFVVAADNTVYLGLSTLANVASGAKIPLFVSDPMQAGKGAAVGFGVKYERWGYMSGLKVVDLLKKRRSSAPNIIPIEECVLMVNKKAAASQGLAVPQELLSQAVVVE